LDGGLGFICVLKQMVMFVFAVFYRIAYLY
jgi:hypothetical protein